MRTELDFPPRLDVKARDETHHACLPAPSRKERYPKPVWVDAPPSRPDHEVRIITIDQQSFARILALANVIERNDANDWHRVHGDWISSYWSCMTIRFSRKWFCVRLLLEMRRVVDPDLYSLDEGSRT